MVKKIIFSNHSLDQIDDRGATKDEVKRAIWEGERISAKEGRLAFRKNFLFASVWKGKYYRIKQVMPIVVEEEKFVVVTVYVFYFGGENEN